MAKSVNKVILVGNLGKDPEVKYTPQGTAVAKITVATSSSYKDKTSGEWQETTEVGFGSNPPRQSVEMLLKHEASEGGDQ